MTTVSEILQHVKMSLDILYPETDNYQPTIPHERQMTEIERLKATIPFEQFFFVFNLTKRTLEYTNGVTQWLGYPDAAFSVVSYFSIIHPAYLSVLNINAQAAFQAANSGSYSVQFMRNKVVVNLPLKHRNGNYILVKRSLYPFQIDADGRVTAYLNHFVVLKPFEVADTIEPRVGNEHRLVELKEQAAVRSLSAEMANQFAKNINLSPKEWQILRYIAKNPAATHDAVAENLQINLTTLKKTDNHRILRKLRNYFKADFRSLQQAATYLAEQGVF